MVFRIIQPFSFDLSFSGLDLEMKCCESIGTHLLESHNRLDHGMYSQL